MLPLPSAPHPQVTKAYLLQLFLLGMAFLACNKKLQGILKQQKAQFEGTEQASNQSQMWQQCWNYQTTK